MLKELDAVKDLLEEEYKLYSAQLSEAQKQLLEQEKRIAEQDRFIEVLEQERETKGDFLSAYNNDDTVLRRLKEEIKKKQQIEEDCLTIKNTIKELTDKAEKYKTALAQLDIVNQEDHIIISEQLMKETDEVLNAVVTDYSKEFKSFAKTVEEYIYMDAERVKVELQKYMKETSSTISRIRSIRKKLKSF